MELAQLVAPARALVAAFQAPVADAGRARGELEAAAEFERAARIVDALGDVERDADEGDRPALGVALDDAAHHHVAPLAVGAPVARLGVVRPVAAQGGFDRRQHARQILGVDEGADLGHRHAVGLRLDLQQRAHLVVVVHALGGEVVAPDRDAGQVHRERELGHRLVVPARQRPAVRVVHDQAEHALGPAVGAVLHDPLRMQVAQHAVGALDAVMVRVAAGALDRAPCRPDERRPVAGDDGREQRLLRRRLAAAAQTPHAEERCVPGRAPAAQVALEDAQPAHLARQAEQFGGVLGGLGLGAALRDRGQRQPARAVGQRARFDEQPVEGPAVGAALHLGLAGGRGQRLLQPRGVGRVQPEQRRERLAARLCVERQQRGTGRVGPAQCAGGVDAGDRGRAQRQQLEPEGGVEFADPWGRRGR